MILYLNTFSITVMSYMTGQYDYMSDIDSSYIVNLHIIFASMIIMSALGIFLEIIGNKYDIKILKEFFDGKQKLHKEHYNQ